MESEGQFTQHLHRFNFNALKIHLIKLRHLQHIPQKETIIKED